MDVFLTAEARREVEALRAARLGPSGWGALIGHRRGFRFIVEKAYPAGSVPAVPDEKLLRELDRVWPGRVIGLFAIRPGRAFRRAVLDPLCYGKLILQLGLSGRPPAAAAFMVEFDRKFFLAPVPFAHVVKEKKDG